MSAPLFASMILIMSFSVIQLAACRKNDDSKDPVRILGRFPQFEKLPGADTEDLHSFMSSHV